MNKKCSFRPTGIEMTIGVYKLIIICNLQFSDRYQNFLQLISNNYLQLIAKNQNFIADL